ncbi:thioesterase family protein [Virgibacillus siamensis]|uniref:thioesterase family protein n=1 Tax=Virgibacillus siamensis TaxID=480071 RepID=UPI0009875E0A|nr:thioesterase family protein [Virgibacillus siamensis]
MGKIILRDHVREDWIDYNGHMNDAEYVRAFSWGVDALMNVIGITEQFRDQNQYTMFTLENHVCYLVEMELDELLEIHLSILDYDAKRVHAFFELYGNDGKRAATSEQMLMGMDQEAGRAAPFPEAVFAKVTELAANYTPAEKPKEAGRVIGIRKK